MTTAPRILALKICREDTHAPHLTPVARLAPAEVLVGAILVGADPVSLLAAPDWASGTANIAAAAADGPRPHAAASTGSPAHLLLLHCALDLHLKHMKQHRQVFSTADA